VIGYAISLAVSEFLTRAANFPIYFSYKPFFAGLSLAWIVGILAGLQPARKAADINPIEAIRK